MDKWIFRGFLFCWSAVEILLIAQLFLPRSMDINTLTYLIVPLASLPFVPIILGCIFVHHMSPAQAFRSRTSLEEEFFRRRYE